MWLHVPAVRSVLLVEQYVIAWLYPRLSIHSPTEGAARRHPFPPPTLVQWLQPSVHLWVGLQFGLSCLLDELSFRIPPRPLSPRWRVILEL